MDNEKIVYHYWGDDEYLAGVPPRDLTQFDLDQMDAGAHRLIMDAEVVRWVGNKEKRYKLYNKTARPRNMAKDLLPDDVEKARAEQEADALEAALKAQAEADENQQPGTAESAANDNR